MSLFSQNGGDCVNHVPGYFCNCKEGFKGEHCEINIDECILRNSHISSQNIN